jgi:hypothetical protein
MSRNEESAPYWAPASALSSLPLVLRLQTHSDAIWKLQRLGKESTEQRILEILEVADAVISQAQTLEAARQLCGVAEIVRTCTSELSMAQKIQNDAVSFCIRSEYHAGQLLKAARDRGELCAGSRGQLHGRTPSGEPNIVRVGAVLGNLNDAPPEKPTLAQVGIDKHFAQRIRRWESLSSEVLEARIAQRLKAGKKLSKQAILNGGPPKRRRRERRRTTGAAAPGGESRGAKEKPSEEPRSAALLGMLRDLRDNPLDGSIVAELATEKDLDTFQAVQSFFKGFYQRLQQRFPQPQPEVAS